MIISSSDLFRNDVNSQILPSYLRPIIQLTEYPINPLSFVKIDRVREIAWLDSFRLCDCNWNIAYYILW